MLRPAVSIIVPIYNVEDYLERCIESIRSQTLKNIEIILIDDESPDHCPKICDHYATIDSRIKVVHKKNGGLGFARNSGMKEATGEYIAFVDSDDYVSEDLYERLYKIAKEKGVDAVLSGYVTLSSTGVKQVYENPYGNRSFAGDEIKKLLLGMLGAEPNYKLDQYVIISACTTLYSSEIIRRFKIEFYSERQFISEDMIFNMDFFSKCKTVYTTDIANYFYSYNENSLTHVYNPKRFELIKLLYYKELEIVSDLNMKDDADLRIKRTFLGNTRVCLKQIVLSEDMTYSDKLVQIKMICYDNDVLNLLRDYPWYKNPIKQTMLSLCIKAKLPRIIYFLVVAANKK